MDPLSVAHIFLETLLTGVIYSTLAIGINFIVNVVKMINWAMGEFYLIGGYVQYYLVTLLFGAEFWWIAILFSMATVFVIGVLYQRFFLRPMFSEVAEMKQDYATVITIATAVFITNSIAYAIGPHWHAPPSYLGLVSIFGLTFDGNKLIALSATVILLLVFYVMVKKTWTGKACRASAQNRVAAESSGIDLQKYDQIAFGVGVALAAAAGALLAAVFPLTAQSGKISTMKGFEIIVIGGVGSISGALVGGIILAVVEATGSVLLSASFRDIYGFILMLLILALKPSGLFGEIKREV